MKSKIESAPKIPVPKVGLRADEEQARVRLRALSLSCTGVHLQQCAIRLQQGEGEGDEEAAPLD